MGPTLLQCIILTCVSITTTAQAQQQGQFFRPTGDQVSGIATARSQFLRSPCPALNALANHGFIPRDGRNLTPQMLRSAIMQVYNVDLSTAMLQTATLPFRLTLADLSQHNFIEHDSSLVHADASYRQDPAQVDGALANDFLGRAANGQLGIHEVGLALRDRLAWCKQKQPGCDFRSNQRSIMFREAATLLQVFGGKRGATISVAHAYSFMVLEQIPADWQRPATSVTLMELEMTSFQIQMAAGA